MLLMIDNYDSFTYNLYQYLSELGVEVEVFRNDKISVEDCLAMQPDKIVISPGPCTPHEAGISVPLVRSAGNIPLLGVCLGQIMHGKTSPINHDNKGVFAGLAQDFDAIRYHSLVLEKTSIPDEISVTATTPSGLIMGIRHKNLPIEGVQFHPESIMTENGHQLLKNFLDINLN